MASLQWTLRDHDKFVLPILAQAWELEFDDPTDDGLPKALERLMTDPVRMRTVLEGLQDRERSALQFLLNQGKRGVMPAQNFTLIYGEPRKIGAAQLARENPLTNPANVSEALFYRGLISFAHDKSEQGARKIVYIPEELIPLVGAGASYQTVYEEDEFDENFDDEDDDEAAAPVMAVPKTTAPPTAPRTPPPLKAEPSAPVKTAAPADSAARPAQAAPAVKAASAASVMAVKADSTAPADTTLVDDLTTILAAISRYEQAEDVNVFNLLTAPDFAANLFVPEQERVIFLLSIAMEMNLIRYRDGRLEINRLDQTRALPKWLSAARPEQIRLLAEAWRATALYIDLARVPGLRVDAQAGTTDFFPHAARKAALGLLAAAVPDEDWWPIDGFIGYVQQHNPIFQRPNGDYQAWYIYDAATDAPLIGAEHWPAVDGALLRFYVELPLHWLGLIDLGQMPDGRAAARLNAYGRAFIKGGAFPKPPDPADKPIVEADGRIVVGRRVPRADRYQVARFTSWDGIVNGSFSYRLDADGFASAKQQAITLEQIESFLHNVSGGLPDTVKTLLETWRRGGSAVTLERVIVLRVTAPEVLDLLWEDPGTRRYFGARLGPTAVIVRADQPAALRETLEKRGVQVDLIGDVR